jgi:hypothetical protein
LCRYGSFGSALWLFVLEKVWQTQKLAALANYAKPAASTRRSVTKILNFEIS